MGTVEEWRDAIGFWPYQVSSTGRVRRSPDSPKVNHVEPGHVLSLIGRDAKGYVQFSCYSGGKRRTLKVHRLVAAAFLGPRPSGQQINHKSGIKADNSAANLEYATGLDNMRHAKRLGLLAPVPRGRANQHSGANRPRKLDEQNVREIRARLAGGEFARTIAADFDIHEMTVNEIRRREIWAWV